MGTIQKPNDKRFNLYSRKSGFLTIVFFCLFSYFALHRFYVGRYRGAFYLLGLEIFGIICISAKLLIIKYYYYDIPHNIAYSYYNIIGTIGYILFIIVFLNLFSDIRQILSGVFLDSKQLPIKF